MRVTGGDTCGCRAPHYDRKHMPNESVHVFYAGAHLIKPGLLDKLRTLALNALARHGAGDQAILDRVRERLEQGAIEDLRIDFEDGFGIRSDAEEDAFAQAAGEFAADALALPPKWGIRLRSMAPATRQRALRTLERFVQTGTVPPVVALPKINQISEIEELVRWLDSHHLPCRLELLVETAQAIRILPDLIEACAGRGQALHFGAYDFLSELGVASPDQSLDHPFCDQARYAIQLAAAAAELQVFDGVTHLLPLGDDAQSGWDLHLRNVQRSLAQGFYASWDLHPAQTAARYLALFTYFDQHKKHLAARLANFLERQTQATRLGAAFDDAATVRGLARFFARGLHCGALSAAEVETSTGLTAEELNTLL
jgi:citrate lyase beta subunit